MLGIVNRLMLRIERAMAFLGATSIVLIMAIVTMDVFMRYAFRRPITGVAELVGLYLMVLLFYSTLSYTFARDRHIRVDLLTPFMSNTLRRWLEAATCVAAAIVLVLIALPSLESAMASYRAGAVLAGLIAWPTWIPPALVATGCLALALRLSINAIGHLAALAGLSDAIDLPTPTGADEEVHR